MSNNPTPVTTFLRRREVERLAGLCRSSIYTKMQEGTFPKPIRLDSRAVRWDEAEILKWQLSRIRASKEGAK